MRFDLVAGPNNAWIKNTALFVEIVSNKHFDINGKYSKAHHYDAGAAWEHLALDES